MRIIILGAGTSGRMLARRLCAENHDVVLIDTKQAALDRVESQLDVLTVHGDCTDPRVLEAAEITRCDMAVAVTNLESVNILSCSLAHVAGVPRIIARVSNLEYTKPDSPFNLQKLGIDFVVNQQRECANDLFNLLQIPGAQEVVDLLDGRVLCVGFMLPTDSPLIMSPLKDYPDPKLLSTVRFVAYTSGGKLKIPRGDTLLGIGDMLYLIGEPERIRAFLEVALPSETPYTRVVVSGGGGLGMQLAHRLEGTPLDVTLIEEDPVRAEYCSELLHDTLVIRGSSLNQDIMQELGINDRTTFVAVTGDDENNIMSCLVAEKMGAHFTTARVDKADYRPIIDSLALLDRTVSPHSSLINAIYHFVRGQNIHGDRQLEKIPGEVLEVTISEGHDFAFRKIIDVELPRGAIISMVLRGEELIVATGEVTLQPNDRVLLYGLPKSVKKLDALLND